MANLNTIEIKAHLPAKDFELSKRFYQDLGFTVAWSSKGLAYLHHGKCSFLLQKHFVKEFADNLQMHLLVEDVDAWWQKVQQNDIAVKYGVVAQPPEDRPWGLRDFPIIDPAGVCWRIAQEIEDSAAPVPVT